MTKKRKVYSPDITSYKFEGTEGLASTIAYVLVAPFRIVSRVMHNIFVIPANIQDEFAEGLLVVASVVSVLGLIDLFVYHKWVLLVSQLPLFPVAIRLRQVALAAVEEQSELPEVDIDRKEVQRKAYEVYDDLKKIN